MRYNITKRQSTKHERIVYEILKELRLPFKHRWIVGGYEIDFLVKDKFAIEINGHEQDPERNNALIVAGYVPIHFSNQEVLNRGTIINIIIKQCLQKQN